ncbi:MAG: helix-turn-helix domain-containing protein, partial [Alphaproteobacteria bacterium]|nr:helix-turn-helix domain-containing protein [Alphaproteobacteria bacterium]
RSLAGLSVDANRDLSILDKADLIVVPGWRSGDGEGHEIVSDQLKARLQSLFDKKVKFASICSGVFLLAGCGFLDQREATTHWRYIDKLQQDFPTLTVKPDVLYVGDGQVYTSAGSAAGIDLCLHLVRQYYGHEKANAVARRLVVAAQREGGQAQFIPRPVPKEAGVKLAPLLDKIQSDLAGDWQIPRMAEVSGFAPRTLIRRFKENQGMTPSAWVTAQRVAYARQLLETTDMAIPEIATIAGFDTPETLRHHFRKAVKLSPSQYRLRFGQEVVNR